VLFPIHSPHLHGYLIIITLFSLKSVVVDIKIFYYSRLFFDQQNDL
jgi:hypothetical protein